ncbi:MAG: succinyl-diaminopimelate desuccinylase [Alphaproteobacteria bacterium]|nr:succinyl-diaminopimelate desuccinylase [Alphaproteobacteria bacterium]
MELVDPVELTRSLIRCPSVTPIDAGCLDRLQVALERIGFQVLRLPFEEPGTDRVDNLYARFGTRQPNFCFAGHTDVVPPGDLKAWSVDPFAAEIIDGYVYGRGAADMKSAIAAFTAAAARFAARWGEEFGGSISMLITGDEEGPSVNGTAKVLSWLRARREPIDMCIVGEPTNPTSLGEMIKIGRRGSLNAVLTMHGLQGHVAYPHLADNPIERLVRILSSLTGGKLDQGNEHFQPSNLALTSIDVGNPATNVIPARATARFNIRFNNLHTGASLTEWLHERASAEGGRYELDVKVSGESFLTPPGRLSEIAIDAIRKVTGKTPELSTTGGTSDARFIKDVCPVAEFGMVGQTMHKVDERASLQDIAALTEIYLRMLEAYFGRA